MITDEQVRQYRRACEIADKFAQMKYQGDDVWFARMYLQHSFVNDETQNSELGVLAYNQPNEYYRVYVAARIAQSRFTLADAENLLKAMENNNA